jgi:septal ring factor EnvC (AmiA/AmiB activator)
VQFAFCANSYENIEKQIKKHKNKSDSLQNLISKSEKKILELSKKEDEQLSQLNEIEQVIETSNLLIMTVSKQIDSVSVQKEQTKIDLEKNQNLLNVRKGIMTARLVKMYKMGKPSVLSIILGSDSPEEIISRIRYMQDLNKYDRNLLDTIKQNEQKLLEQTKIYEAQTEYLKELLEQRIDESEKVRMQALTRKQLLEELRREKDKWEISMHEYVKAQTELNSIIEELSAETIKQPKITKSDFPNKKGKLIWPVSGNIISNFGKIVHPEYKTIIMNNGIDIEAPIGTPVKSVYSGVVEFVGRMRGYGKIVIINHYGNFLTIYAHLNNSYFEKGAKVNEGTIIGSVGESGSLEGTKLHFEIRNENNALNPNDWLKK